MINQSVDESVVNNSTMEQDTRQNARHSMFTAFMWRRKSRENKLRQEWKRDDSNDSKVVEHRLKTASTSKTSFGFFRNIKKHLHIQNLYKSKRKSKEAEVSSLSRTTNLNAIVSVIGPLVGPHDSCHMENDRQKFSSNDQSVHRFGFDVENLCHDTEDSINVQCSIVKDTNLDPVPTEQWNEPMSDIELVNSVITTETSYSNEIEEVYAGINETLSNENRVKASLAEELLKLSKYGWYWGPISGDEADAKLISEPDGAFLVRDSSDDRYVLTLSFKSSGKMLHARLEHSGGLFSLCNQCEGEGFTSVAALINHSMNFSQSAVFCYSRPRYPGHPSFPVRLTKPVSRFTQVRSLQYLCRFVIRQNTRLDNIHKLPLPKTIKGYIQEAHY